MEIAKKNWFALEITVDYDASEAVEYALNSLDALGTEINHFGTNKPEYLTNRPKKTCSFKLQTR
ncbi:MAG TPA: hypothetical protein PKE69_08890 [Pyrinomonadaceae bacterium]|nr:hypothetical protein [Pyrinomonadaceae bacterium]